MDEGDRLVGGLGQLVDGQIGTDNFRTDIHGYGKGMFLRLYEKQKTKYENNLSILVCGLIPMMVQTKLQLNSILEFFEKRKYFHTRTFHSRIGKLLCVGLSVLCK